MPEAILFYKADDTRARDWRDFMMLRRQKRTGPLAWLRDAIARVHPNHWWLDEL